MADPGERGGDDPGLTGRVRENHAVVNALTEWVGLEMRSAVDQPDRAEGDLADPANPCYARSRAAVVSPGVASTYQCVRSR